MQVPLLEQIPSEAKIRGLIKRAVYGKNLRCPRCRYAGVKRSEDRYRCPRCRRPFSLLTGTWLEGSKLSYQQLWTLLWCWTQAIPVLQTQKLCGMNEKTVSHWYRQFRLHVPQIQGLLQGQVQMDEAYFKDIALLMAKQIKSQRQLAFVVVPKTAVDKQLATQFLFQYVQPRSTLQTDGGSIYKKIQTRWPVEHRTDIHKRFEFGLTSEIEGLFGNLRTFIRRMYHHVRPEYLAEYISEFCVRFSSPELFTSPSTYLAKTLLPCSN